MPEATTTISAPTASQTNGGQTRQIARKPVPRARQRRSITLAARLSNKNTLNQPVAVASRPSHTEDVVPHASSTVCAPGGIVTLARASPVEGWTST